MPWAVAAAAVAAGAGIYSSSQASSDAKKAREQVNAGTPSWQLAKPDLQNVLAGAQNLYNKGSKYYDFNTVQPLSDQTLASLRGMEQMASGNNGLYDQSRTAAGNLMTGSGGLQSLSDAASGKFLSQDNPYFNTMWSGVANDVENAVNSQFSASGRTGSPAHAGVMARELGNIRGQLGYQDYARERQNQMQAADRLGSYASQGIQLAPSVDNFGYSNLSRLGQVGSAYEQQGARTLADQMARWDFNQNRPWEDLNRYANIASTISGQGQTGYASPQPASNAFSDTLGLTASMIPMFKRDPNSQVPQTTAGTTNGPLGPTTALSQPSSSSWFGSLFDW